MSLRLWLFSAVVYFVAGILVSEVWFGWATEEELQPNIDGLSFDEVLLMDAGGSPCRPRRAVRASEEGADRGTGAELPTRTETWAGLGRQVIALVDPGEKLSIDRFRVEQDELVVPPVCRDTVGTVQSFGLKLPVQDDVDQNAAAARMDAQERTAARHVEGRGVLLDLAPFERGKVVHERLVDHS